MKRAIGGLRSSVFQKLDMNAILVRAWGVEDSNDRIRNVTAKYRDFLLAIASGKV